MQRVLSKKSSMQQLYGLATAVLAAGTLSVCAPALAAPNGDAPAISVSEIVLADAKKATGDGWQVKDLDRTRKMEKNETRRDRTNTDGRDDDGDRNRDRSGDNDNDNNNDDDRNWSHGDDDDRDDGDRNWDRSGDRDDDRNWSRGDDGDRDESWRRNHRSQAEGRHDRGNHYGWERGKHRGWDKNGGHPGYDGDRSDNRGDWRAERRGSRWTGQPIDRIDSQVMRDYGAYGLPRPGEGQYYARSNNDVYLVTERTQRIQDAFVLRNYLR